jgi:hypothetical protein
MRKTSNVTSKRWWWLPAVVVLFVLGGSAAPAFGSPCVHAGEQVEARGEASVILFHPGRVVPGVGQVTDDRYFGCLLRHGRRVAVDTVAPDDFVVLALRGRWLVFVAGRVRGPDDGPGPLVLVDLTNGEERAVTFEVDALRDDSIRLRRNGSLAFFSVYWPLPPSPPTGALVACPIRTCYGRADPRFTGGPRLLGRHTQVLTRGQISVRSLVLRGRVLHWREAGESRSATLH